MIVRAARPSEAGALAAVMSDAVRAAHASSPAERAAWLPAAPAAAEMA